MNCFPPGAPQELAKEAVFMLLGMIGWLLEENFPVCACCEGGSEMLIDPKGSRAAAVPLMLFFEGVEGGESKPMSSRSMDAAAGAGVGVGAAGTGTETGAGT